MSRKSMLTLILGAALSLVLSGCIDLFAVPGVAVSPDGSTVYFLAGTGLTDSTTGGSNLVSLSLGSDTPEVIFQGSDTVSPSGFAVNPSNGDVAYVTTNDDGTTSLSLYNPAAGARELVSADALGRSGLATSMAFSPDGSRLAIAMIVAPPGQSFDSSDSDMSAEQMQMFDSVLLVVDVNSGSVTEVSDAASEWVNHLTWNPSGTSLAYNAWQDSNADSNIDITGGLMAMDMSGNTDRSQIKVLDVASGSVSTVESTTSDFAPEFVSDTVVAFISFDLMAGGGLQTHDLSSGTTTMVQQSSEMILGIALSPDGSKVAWTQTAPSDPNAEESDTSTLVYVANADFSNPQQLLTMTGLLGDVPVWMPDSSSILVASTNIFSSMIGQMTAAFAGMAEESAETEEIPVQQIIRIDVNTGEQSVLYEGTMTNSNALASLFSLAGNEDLMSGLEGEE